jgi:predicted DCC family thiol-disulfide oxidoreductase YuxK
MTRLPEAIAHEPRAVIVFDGQCKLCCFTVRFVAPRDRKGLFAFLPAQSALGREVLSATGQDPDDPETFLLIENDAVYGLSDAALRIGRRLSWPWSWLSWIGTVVPRPLRDWAYLVLARNRRRWFGSTAVCMVPDEALRARFVG